MICHSENERTVQSKSSLSLKLMTMRRKRRTNLILTHKYLNNGNETKFDPRIKTERSSVCGNGNNDVDEISC